MNAITAVSGAICALPGCSKPAFHGGAYCSKTHRDTAAAPAITHAANNRQRICEYPGCPKNVYPGSQYCSKGHRDAMINASPGLIELQPSDPKYTSVSTQFTTKWLHPNSTPRVHKIFKVIVPTHIRTAYEAYRKDVQKKRALLEGNQCRRFHGTPRTCKLGEGGSTTLCQHSDCSLCGIIRTSFKMSLAGTNKPWLPTGGGRFGPGVYTSSTSSKADSYSSNNKGAANLKHKAMLLNKVVVGKSVKLNKSNPKLRSPPGDHDSVIGEPGGSLNYDELIVYEEHAVIPAYLILYG